MSQRLSQIKVAEFDGFGGNFVDSDYLAAAWNAGQPIDLETTMAEIFSSSSRFTGKPLLGMTLGKGNYKEIDDEIFRWRLQGAEEKCLISMENLEVNNQTPGINGETFRIKLDEDWYSYPDVIFPEDNEYAIEIVSGPIQDGNGYIYECKLQDDNPQSFIPNTLLDEGQEFTKVWTSVPSEYNKEFGTQQYPNSFQLESQVGFFAQKVQLTDKALRNGKKLGIPFKYNGKVTYKFLPMALAKMRDELYMSMEAQMYYGKRSTSPGPDGYWKKTGPGLRQQLADGWIEHYSGALTETRLRDYLMDIFFSRVEEGDRKVTVMTGTMGSMMFHDLLAASAQSFLTVDTHYITGKDPRHLSYGAQFTHYRGPEGIDVTLIKNPLYDSRRYSRKMHPTVPNKPLDSWRMTFMDFGKSDGEDNIQMLKVKDTYKDFYVPGSVGPSGMPINNGGAAYSAVPGCSFHVEGSASLWMKDVTRGGELILDFED